MNSLPKVAPSQRVIPIVALENDSSVVASLYASDTRIYARSVSGWFNRWRWGMVWLTQLVFYGFPWLPLNGRQALLFDLADRFYIFNLVLYPQDLIYLTGLLVIIRCRCFCSRRLLAACGAATPALKLCTPKFSCGSNARSKATGLPACGSTSLRRVFKRLCARAPSRRHGLLSACGPVSPLWATSHRSGGWQLR